MAHHPIRRAAAAACMLAVLAACSDDSPALPGTGEPPDLGASGGVPSSVATRPRFDVKLEVGGSLRPGQPVVITGIVTGMANSADAQIELVLPEYAAAQASGWSTYQPWTNGRVPAATTRRGAVGKGGRNVVQQTVTFPLPGVYTVVASARVIDHDSIPDVEDGAMLLDQGQASVVLVIDENGGRVMSEFDARVLPATAVSAPGPLQLRTGVNAPPATLPIPPREPSSSRAGVAAAPGTPARQTGSMRMVTRYYDPVDAVYRLPEGALWYLYYYDSAFNYTGYGRSGYLPADGSVSVGCSEAYWARLVVYGKSTRVTVGDSTNFRDGQIIADYGVYPATDCPKGTVYGTAQAVPAHVFTSLNKTALRAETLFGRTRPTTPAVITGNTSLVYSTYCPPTGNYQGCTYGGDYLRIQTNNTTAYGEQVWGQTGVFITSHEYGHAYHEKALGGFLRYFSGCGTHSLTALATSMRCALPEGFADYFAVVTRPDETGYDYAWETNYYYTSSLAGTDGSRSEAAVSAMFYDLVDTNRWGTETHDVVAYANSVVGDVITGCQVYENGYWILNNGIDHLVYCFERKVDTAITTSTKYFPTRSPDPTSWSVTSTTTSPTEVRKIWKKDLYNEI